MILKQSMLLYNGIFLIKHIYFIFFLISHLINSFFNFELINRYAELTNIQSETLVFLNFVKVKTGSAFT